MMRRLKPNESGNPCGVDRLLRFVSQGIDCRNWYREALRDAETVCSLEGWNLSRFISVLSMTSPKSSVLRNVRTTFTYMEHNRTFANTLSLTNRLLEHYELTGEIGIGNAPKINAFYRALSGDENAIVLDVWMSYALRVEQRRFDSRRVRQACEKRVKACAKRIGCTPSQCQAMIWGGVNRLYGRQPGKPRIVAEWHNWQLHNRNYPRSGVVEVKTYV